MKVPIERAQAHVRGEFYEEGSVLRETVTSACTGITLQVEIESPGEPEQIAKLMRSAERNCFVSQAIVNPVEVELRVTHNGATLETSEGEDAGK
jgi:organic hydroperoxide reductase OsmC/OhrA